MKCDALRKKTTRVNDSTDNVNLLLVTEYRKMLIDVRNDSFCRIMWRQHEPLPIGSSARCVMTMQWPFLRIACRYAVTHDVTLKDHHTQNYIYVECLLILVLIYAAYVILCAMALSQGCWSIVIVKSTMYLSKIFTSNTRFLHFTFSNTMHESIYDWIIRILHISFLRETEKYSIAKKSDSI